MVNLGERLRELRTEKELSQAQVAKRMGVSPAIISSYENSVKQPSLENLVKIAYLYNVSTDYLLGISDRKAVKPKNLVSLDGLDSSKRAIVKQLIVELKDS